MSVMQSGVTTDVKICLHPSVGLHVDPAKMTPSQKVAAVAMVRCLEHDLFHDHRTRGTFSPDQAERLVAKINDLRKALGWLQINPDGNWRWPQ